MNNGLRGRYLDQLEAWNNARRFASDLVEAYHNSGESIKDTLSEWGVDEVNFPSLTELKRMVSEVLFVQGRDAIDKIARSLMKLDGWYEIEPPEEIEELPEMKNRRAVMTASA